MLLRSSSTPVLESSLSSHSSEIPNRDIETIFATITSRNNKLPHYSPHTPKSLSCNSSPIANSASGFFNPDKKSSPFNLNFFRRTQSDGNLEKLRKNLNLMALQRQSSKTTEFALYSAPSFSIYNSEDGFGENDREELKSGDFENRGVRFLERAATIGETIDAVGSYEFSFQKECMDLIQEEGENDEDEALGQFQKMGVGEDIERPPSPPMYLATGLGIGNGGCDMEFGVPSFEEGQDVEEFYKRVLVQDPYNPLFLRNYARLLQSKGDLYEAEKYYYRATVADPADGEILSQYAKLVWDLHHDQERALNYFDKAAQAASTDSHVLAAYASFLWEIEDDVEEDALQKDQMQNGLNASMVEFQNLASKKEEREPPSVPLHLAAGLGIHVAGPGGNIDGSNYVVPESSEVGNMDECYKKMIEENPCNSLILRNYAEFLYLSKGDLHGAEYYYSRAVLADPVDGEIMSQYAKLVWELYRDQDKASTYFERAVQAAPTDSHVLAAYASFLWEIQDDGEEDDSKKDQVQKLASEEEEREPPNAPLHVAAGLGIQSKGDLQGAEEYYSRAILADPTDGEIISQYARLIWELYQDQDKASIYFGQAVQAAPTN
ncbi:hypothetical protein RJ641_003795, partial [Dillenia turbinata]